ncbi:GumC family protein [Alsobacter sp. SYSU BS001988]
MNQYQRTHETMAAYERLHLAAAEERGGETLAAAWASVVRQWRVVLAAAGVGLVVALAFLAVTPPQYSARALVLIDPKNDFSVRATRAPTDSNTDSANIESQVEILRSDRIVRKVIEAENLVDHPAFRPGVLSQVISTLKFWDRETPAKTELARMEATTRALQKQVTAKRLGLTYVVELTATMPDPVEAARVVNAYAHAYMDGQLQFREELASRTSKALQERTEELKKQAQNAERAVEELKFSGSLQGENSASARVALKNLESTAQTYRVIHDKFLERYAETLQQQYFTVPDAQIVSAGFPPLNKSYPKTLIVLATALFLSAALGSLLALLLDRRLGGARLKRDHFA